MLDHAEVDRRMQAATLEIEAVLGLPNYYCVVTDTIDGVVDKVHSFMQSGAINREVDYYSRGVMRTIWGQLR